MTPSITFLQGPNSNEAEYPNVFFIFSWYNEIKIILLEFDPPKHSFVHKIKLALDLEKTFLPGLSETVLSGKQVSLEFDHKQPIKERVPSVSVFTIDATPDNTRRIIEETQPLNWFKDMMS